MVVLLHIPLEKLRKEVLPFIFPCITEFLPQTVFDLVSDKPGTPDVAQKQKPVHKMLLHQSNMLPSSFINMFHSRNQIDSYAFRSADLYISHFSRNRYFTILFRDLKMWNALPNWIQSAEYPIDFKRAITTCLLINWEWILNLMFLLRLLLLYVL